MTRLAVFASGAGTNARAIIRYFRQHPQIAVAAIFCNRPQAGVIKVAAEEGISLVLFDRNDLYETGRVLHELQQRQIDRIILAGFLWKVPPALLQAFPDRIINIHPALLPRHGGPGMYGMRVHQAVLAAGDAYSGITIHLVNEHYDSGPVLFQRRIPIPPGLTAEQLAARIHELEHYWYPHIIEQWVQGQLTPAAR